MLDEKRGFTLVEMLVSLGILSSLAAVIMSAVNPRAALVKAYDAVRRHHVTQLENGFSQLHVDGIRLPEEDIIGNESEPVDVCRNGVVRDSSCLNVDLLVPTYLPKIPVDSVEPCESYSGYKVYTEDSDNIEALAKHIGKLKSDTVQRDCIFDTVYPLITDVEATNVTTNSATITWTTDELSNSKVSHATGMWSDDALVTQHAVDITGLTNGTEYVLTIHSMDPSGNLGTFEGFTFSTIDTVPPEITGIQVSSIGDKTATVTWGTDEDANNIVEYGLTPSYGQSSGTSTLLTRDHSVSLSGLLADTTYYFKAVSRDGAGNTGESDGGTFVTMPDVNPPVITGVSTKDTTNTTTTVVWTTDEPSDSQVEFGDSPDYGSTTPLSSDSVTDHAVLLTGLTTNATYHFRVLSTDPSGNSAASENYTATIVDVTGPVISNLQISNIAGESATVTWDTNESATGQVEYGTAETYGSVTTLNTTMDTSHSVQLSGLTRDEMYHVRVLSRDSSGNLSSSNDATFSTDFSYPAILTINLTVDGDDTVTITWDTNEDAIGRIEYGVNGGFENTTEWETTYDTSHSVTISGLASDIEYTYGIAVEDRVGNAKTYYTYRFTIDTTPPVIQNLSVTPISGFGVEFAWHTNEPANRIIDFGKTLSYETRHYPWNYYRSYTTTFRFIDLDEGATYYYRVSSSDPSGNTTEQTGTFTIDGDTTPPTIVRGPWTYALHATSTYIFVDIDEYATIEGEYGETASYGSTCRNTGLRMRSFCYLSNLQPSTEYHIRIRATDLAGLQSDFTQDFTFTTGADTTPPTIISESITDLTPTSVTVSLEADETLYYPLLQFFRGTPDGSHYYVGYAYSRPGTVHNITFNRLDSETTYFYNHLRIQDMAGNRLANFNSDAFTTPAVPAPPENSNITVADQTLSAATITWDTNEPAKGRVEYGTTVAYGSASTIENDFATSHSIQITGLSQNTLYHFRVVSTDDTGDEGASGDFTLTLADSVPPSITNINAAVASDRSVVISWDTDEPATDQVEYGTDTSYGSFTTISTSLDTSHSQTIDGLQPGTTYHFRAVSRDGTGNESTSSDGTFLTTDNTPPAMFGITATNITRTSITVNWSTNEPATGRVEYGTDTSYGSFTTISTSLDTSHSQTIDGLQPGTTYHFRVISSDEAGNEGTSNDLVTDTLADVTPPILSDVSISLSGDHEVTMSWKTDEPANSQVEYGTTIDYGQTSAPDSSLSTSHSVAIGNLELGTSYFLRARSKDANDNLGLSVNFTYMLPDTVPPVLSSVKGLGDLGGMSATITWTTDEPSNSQVEYGANTNYGLVTSLNPDSVTDHSATIPNLVPNTLYHFRVRSLDTSGNLSVSDDASVLTDTIPPVISSIQVQDITASGATITWSTDEPADAEIEFGATVSYEFKTPLDTNLSANHNIVLSDVNNPDLKLDPDTEYHFIVRSKDEVGNVSVSSDMTFRTLALPPEPPPP